MNGNQSLAKAKVKKETVTAPVSVKESQWIASCRLDKTQRAIKKAHPVISAQCVFDKRDSPEERGGCFISLPFSGPIPRASAGKTSVRTFK